ncbi:MAG: phosphate ABC transporter permease PstA [Alphaproteobacteria bacterium]|nr:phosphate ABC transporter permease PstA [Alphaproteobacteria bacterium]
MTDAARIHDHVSDRARSRLRRRYAAERRFRLYGVIAISLTMLALTWLFATVVARGHSAFLHSEVQLEITFSEEVVDPGGKRDLRELNVANYAALVRRAMRARFPEVTERRDRRELAKLASSGAGLVLRDLVIEDPGIIGSTRKLWLPASGDVDMLRKGYIPRDVPESERKVSDKELAWIDALEEAGELRTGFNARFFSSGDSREPELAGIWGAVVGSLFTLLVTLLLSFPIGVGAAVYLEEFAPKNRWTDLVEININNLAAVPSIVFGLLGLAVFLNVFHLPRSAPLVGGLTLALMTLPTIIIASRASIMAVPPSIREAALAMGASHMQVVWHHILPLALPGMLTGSIIGMARALGETAPLLMIGMVAFIVDIPRGPTDPATVLPVQIYLWVDSPERGFLEKTWAAIMVLLVFLVTMNALAVLLRKKFERRW